MTTSTTPTPPLPTRRRRITKQQGPTPKALLQPRDERIAQLTAREKALAIRSRARKRITVDIPLELYAALIEQAEAWDTPLPNVYRVALRRGLEVTAQFATQSNPYLQGALTPPAQSQLDPTGLAWPPTAPAYDPFTGQNSPSIPPFINGPRTASSVTPIDLRGFLPSGATIATGSVMRATPPVPPHEALIPDEEEPEE